MRVPEEDSAYKEGEHARDEFSQSELQHARALLRRLRFLEAQVRANENDPVRAASGGALFAVMESQALEWALGPDGINFLAEKEGEPA